jgi:hypothetical protein
MLVHGNVLHVYEDVIRVQEVPGGTHTGAPYPCMGISAAQQTDVAPMQPMWPMSAPNRQEITTQAWSGTATSEKYCKHEELRNRVPQIKEV